MVLEEGWEDAFAYERIVLTEWGIDPMIIENCWTDDFYNMMIHQFVLRKMAEDEDAEKDRENREQPEGGATLASPKVNPYVLTVRKEEDGNPTR